MRLIWSESFHGSPEYVRSLLDAGPLVDALEYWDSLPKRNGLPGREDFDPLDIPWLLPDVFVVDVQSEDRFVYRLAGTRLEQLYRRSLKGLTPEDAFEAGANDVMSAFRLVRDTGEVVHRRGLIERDGEGHRGIRFQVVLMPFSVDGDVVSQLFCAHCSASDREP